MEGKATEFGVIVVLVGSGVLETDVLLLSVNMILLLSAIAGRTVKPPKSDEPKMQDMRINGMVLFLKNMRLHCTTVLVSIESYFKIEQQGF